MDLYCSGFVACCLVLVRDLLCFRFLGLLVSLVFWWLFSLVGLVYVGTLCFGIWFVVELVGCGDCGFRVFCCLGLRVVLVGFVDVGLV